MLWRRRGEKKPESCEERGFKVLGKMNNRRMDEERDKVCVMK